MARAILLRKSGKPQRFALVDEKAFARLAQHRWYVTADGYAYRYDDAGRRYFMHVEVLRAPPGYTTDHVNRHRLDNRRRNLRLLTTNAQQHNQGPRKHNTSGFKGVTRDRGKWKAQIMAHRVQHHLGTFDNPAEAALAYDTAARRLHGKYAYQNFRKSP